MRSNEECSFHLTDDESLLKAKAQPSLVDQEGVDSEDLRFLRELEKENQALEQELMLL